ncbi:DNA topoisomerase IV subunit A [Varunaivibrio sulfuroxidans]|uniref:DNA topoisomerase 4 subunit A n=1 Tax=Varunaivibrio sulfuroxidans TaxID=1773489 RepID=A0A4R3JGA2_9PROT|nr:DNA topoisomerase IV subunit A [Varunaivibrio sulfuroxidans]TCS64236.1 DNA topoisomerase IV subunit A [Varunaivibrio sulfuroxidans]WES31323.1 DNA topoisomerase IV subunit A [Varunaivibrio sulfuroxidans]
MSDPAREEDDNIIDTRLSDALSERYLSYALSTIMSRSLPDVRDGLKPVHRRLLFAMRQLKLDPKNGYKKCARVVGDVIGKYHPHGDSAVYETLVRLAQDFAVRYPLVDGQGNFGNIDGDNAAAMRYTESRMTAVAVALMDGLDEDAVDFRQTYDGEDEEPVVLPARFPNLLANGSAGIAVGMATSIPPHNVGELCDALAYMIKHPGASVDKLVDFIPGPDFPTGGILVESRDSVIDAYKTGKGGFRLRARWQCEDLGRGVYQIVITEIPYQVQKSRLIEKIAEMMTARKLPFVDDIRDESAEDIRLVIEPKSRAVDPEMLMEQLFKLTDLETRFSLNMNVLDAARTPSVMDLRQVLQAFLDHRMDVLERRSRHRLEKIDHRLEILGGMLIAFLNLDEVIHIIRTEDEPKAVMIRQFALSDIQAEAILNMRLRQLRKLEEIEIRTEHDALNLEKSGLLALLDDEPLRWKTIGKEIAAIKAEFGAATALGKRRTDIGAPPSAVVVPLEALIEREPITVVCSQKGWVRAIKGHLDDGAVKDLRFKDGDKGRFAVHAQTTDKILVFATNGRFYTLGGDKLPGGRGNGEPLRLMIDLGNEHDVTAILTHDPERRLVVASDSGRGFVVAEKDVIAQTKNGKQVLNLAPGEEAVACAVLDAGADHLAVIGTNRKMLIFPLSELPLMGRGKGVILQRYKKGGGATLNDIKGFSMETGLSWPFGSGWRTETDLRSWLSKRAQSGVMAPRGFPTSNRFS